MLRVNAINFEYSLKNIPTPREHSYLKSLMGKVENSLKRLRWKAYFYENSDENDLEHINNNYGFKSDRAPPQNKYLNKFENAIYDIIKNIEFQGNRNSFQSKLKDDLKKVNTSGKIMVFADKTTNMYESSYKQQCYKNVPKNNTIY